MNSPRGFSAGFIRDTKDDRLQSGRHVAAAPTYDRARISRRHRRVIETTTVRLPAIRTETCAGGALLRDRFRRTPAQRRVGAMTVEVTLKLEELDLQIGRRPKERAVKIFPSNRANESLHEGMR